VPDFAVGDYVLADVNQRRILRSQGGGGGEGTVAAPGSDILSAVRGDADARTLLHYTVQFSASGAFADPLTFTTETENQRVYWTLFRPVTGLEEAFPAEGVEAWWSWGTDTNYPVQVKVNHGDVGGMVRFNCAAANVPAARRYWRLRSSDGVDVSNWRVGIR
jgi:hypothetical protein